MAALLTIEAANTDKLAMYLGECRDLRHPDPAARHQLEPAGVHGRARTASASASCAVKNVGEGAILSMLRRRARSWAGSTRCSRSASTSISGSSTSGRSRAWSRPARSTRWPTARCRSPARPAVRRGRQGDRARRPAPARPRRRHGLVLRSAARWRASRGAIPLPEAPPWTEAQQLAFEKEALGLYMSGHPLERFSDELKAFGAQRIADLTAVARRRLGRRHRQRPAPAEDEEGRPHGGVRARRHRRRHRSRGLSRDVRQARPLIAADAMVLVRGKFEKDDESARLVATELLPIAALKERTAREVAIHLPVPPHGTTDVRGAGRAALAPPRRPQRVAGARREGAAAGRCASAPMSPSGFGRPRSWSRKSSRSAARDRWIRWMRINAQHRMSAPCLSSWNSKSRSACC